MVLSCTRVQPHLMLTAFNPSQIESMCGSTFSSLIDRRHASILGFICRLLDGEGRGNLQTFCPTFKTASNRLSHRLHSFDPAFHLCFVSPCNFRTLDRFRRSWLVTVVALWDSIPAELEIVSLHHQF